MTAFFVGISVSMGFAFSAACRIVGLDGRGVILSVIELSLELFSGGPLPLDSLLSPRLVDNSLLKSGLRSFFQFFGSVHLGVGAVSFCGPGRGKCCIFIFFNWDRTRKSAMMKTVKGFLSHLCGQNCSAEPFSVAGRTFSNARNRR